MNKLGEFIKELIRLTENYKTPLIENKDLSESTLDSIKKTIDYFPDNFMCVINLFEKKLTHIKGIKKKLGYDETNFSWEKSTTVLIPHTPIECDIFMYYAIGFYTIFNSLPNKKSLLNCRYTISFIIRTLNNNFIRVTKQSRITKVDQNYNIASYLNYYTTEPYDGKPTIIRPRIAGGMLEEVLEDVENKLILMVKQKINEQYNLFPPLHERILEYRIAGLKTSEIAIKLNKTDSAVSDHEKRIVRKARREFKCTFPNINSVAEFYHKYGFIKKDTSILKTHN